MFDDVREMVTEQFRYRELLLQMTRRDLLLRYKQTAMGAGWAVFMPLLNTAIFSIVFTRIAPVRTPVPYAVFAYCGLLAWNFFASSLRFSLSSLTGNLNLVTKVYFPREIFPFSSVIVCLIDTLVGSVVLVALMIYYHVPVGAPLLFLPAVVLVHATFTTGVTLALAMANLFYRDVKYLFEVVINVWMFLTSVLYPITLVGGRWSRVMALNPMTAIIDAYRDTVLLNRMPDPGMFGTAAAISFAVAASAWILFHRAEFRFAESV